MKKSLIVVLLVTVLAVLLAVPAIADEPVHTTHCVCGGADADCASHTALDGEWIAWDGTWNITQAGNYYLSADVTGGSQKSLTATNGVINLCLNGHSFASGGRALSIGASTTVNIMNCQDKVGTLKGKGSSGNSGVIMMGGANSILNIYDNVHVEFDSTSASTPSVGGAISLQVGTASLNMYGGTITGGPVSQNGGAVCVNASGASFAMHDGTINGGTATGNGGAVYVAIGASMTMSGGTINGGSAAKGGAVYLDCNTTTWEAGTLTVSGGTITSGTATTSGDCVQNFGGTITLSGDPVIEEIYRSGTVNASGLSGASIGITSNAARDNLTGTVDFAGATCFYSTNDSYKVVLESDNKLSLVAADATGYSCICGADKRGTTHTDACFLVADNMWTEVSAITSATTGYVKLTADVTVNNVNIASPLVIDLNGRTISSSGTSRVFKVSANDTLVITNRSTGDPGSLIPSASFATYGGIFDMDQATSRVYIYGGILDASALNGQYGTVASIGNAGGIMYIHGGTLKGGTASANGAAIRNLGTIYMTGGTITAGKTSGNGGAVSLNASGATLEMSGNARIQGTEHDATNNTANANLGGLIYSDTGVIKMKDDAVICGGAAKTSGGAVILNGASQMTMEGNAKVTGGYAIASSGDYGRGGGIYVTSTSSLIMRGNAEVSNNFTQHATAGAGVHANTTNCTVTLSGNAKITGNFAGASGVSYTDGEIAFATKGAASNLYLPAGKTITVDGELGENANVGVTATVDTAFTGATSAANAQKFHADNSLYIVKQDNSGALMLAVVEHCLCGDPNSTGNPCADAGHTDIQWQPWDGTTALTTAGNYYLTQDITGGSQKTLGVANGTINLCLHGHSIASSDRVFDIVGSAVVNITNCKTEGGVLKGKGASGSNSGVIRLNATNSTLSIYDNVHVEFDSTSAIKPTNGGAISLQQTGDKLYLYGGTITGGTISGNGGAVNLNAGSAFYMYDGTINGGTANLGGAVYVAGTFEMRNGTITGGSANQGGNVCINGGSVTMAGGSITRGKSDKGGGVQVFPGVTFTVSGKVTITGNTKADGTTANNVVINNANAPITIGDGGVTNNSNIGVTLADATIAFTTAADADYSEFFHSDNTDYVVAANATNALMLGIKHCVCGDPTAVITESTHACYGGHTEHVWLPWNGTGTLTEGYYYLSRNVADTVWTARKTLGENGKTLYLCLHGHDAACATRMLQIATGATVHISNCSDQGGTLTAAVQASSNNGNAQVLGTLHIYHGVTMETVMATGTVANGGGVIGIETSGALYMHGGTINGWAATNGGAVKVGSGTSFYMYDGTINGATVTNMGGAVHTAGTFEMHGGSIVGGTAAQGGSVCLQAGSMTMTGGSITGGKSDKGGGVQVFPSSVFKVSGKVTITGNTKADGTTPNNVVINSADTPITIGEGGLNTESRIGVTSTNGGKVVAVTNPTAELVACFVNDNDATHWVDTDSAGIYLRAVGQIWHCVCGDPTANITDSNHHCYGGHTSKKWTAYDGSTAFPTSGYIQLTNSFELALTSHIAVNGELVIDLNNCTVTTTGAARMFKVQANDTVIITDTSENAQGKLVPSTTFTNSYGGVFDMDTATSRVYIYGGSLDASASTGQYGTVAALRVSGASMYIFGGTLTGGTVTGNGAAIRIEPGCSVTMTGGIINGGSTPLSGGAVYVNGGELNMSGTAAIVGGKSTAASGNDYGGGSVAVANSGLLKMSGNAKISGGTATRVGGVVFLNTGTLDMSGNAQIWGANYTGASTKTGGNKGGAVHAVSGTITMKDDTKILGGAANAQGGSINLESSQMTMEDNATVSGGYILTSDNTYGKGGGIALSASSLTMSDNAIVTGNYTTASAHGSGVHAFNAADCTVTLSGNAKITGNYGGATVSGCTDGVITVTKAGTAKNLYLPAGETVTIGDGGMGAAANVGITMADPSQAFTGNVEISDATAFRSDDSAYRVLFDAAGLKLTDGSGAAVVGDVLFADLTAALGAITDPDTQYVELQDNVTGDVTVNSTLYLDLAGFNIAGDVTVTDGTLYVFDTATKDYDVSDGKYGKITGTITGIDTDFVTKSAHYGKQHRYIMIDEGNNTYSFHRIYVGIESILLYPQTTAMDYKLNLLCDEVVKAYIDTYGGEYSVTESVSKDWPRDEINPYDGNADEDTRYNVRKVRVGNILNSTLDIDKQKQYAEQTDIDANAFITLAGGTKITSATITKSLQDVVIAADKLVGSATTSQKHALANMYSAYETLMAPWFEQDASIPGLDVNDYAVNHCVCGDPESTGNPCADAGHKKLSWEAAAATSIRQSGTYYLTEDFAASNSGQISVGTNGSTEKITVYLDLNGNDWTSTGRAFQVFGNATLVLCNSGEEVAIVTGAGAGGGGGVVQTQPGAVLEMYDRVKLSLAESDTRRVTHGGVVYVHNDAKLFMYGGEIAGTYIPQGTSAGVSDDPQGGSVYINARGEFRMSGGTVSGGTVDNAGGNVYVRNRANFIMTGGEITGGQAAKGSAVYFENTGAMTMSGGEITGNTTTGTDSGAVHFGGEATLTLSDNATITGNLNSEAKASNLYVDRESLANIVLGGELTGTVALNNTFHGTFTTKANATAANAEKLVSDNGYQFIVGSEGLSAVSSVTSAYSVGYGEASIDPVDENGSLLPNIHLTGYGNTADRVASYIDSGNGLLATCLAVTDTDGDTVLLIAVDAASVASPTAVRKAVSEATQVPVRNIMISAIHQHSAPEHTAEYTKQFREGVVAAAEAAMADSAAVTGVKTSAVETNTGGRQLNFVRNVSLYEDGKWVGTYGSNHYGGTLSAYQEAASQTAALASGKWKYYESDPDTSMQLLKFERGDGKNIIVANFQTHPHLSVNSLSQAMVTADVVGVFRSKLETTLNDGTRVMYFSGAGGNLNPKDDHLDNSSYSSLEYKSYGNRLAELANTAVYAAAETGNVTAAQKTVTYGIKEDSFSGKTAEQVLARAQEIKAAVDEGTLAAGPFDAGAADIVNYGIYSTYHANKIIQRSQVETGTVSMNINTYSIGGVAFVSAPYEMFDTNGMEIKEHTDNPYTKTFICTQANGSSGYIPSALGYERGGYATDCTMFAAGTGEALVAEYVTMLNAMKAVEAN